MGEFIDNILDLYEGMSKKEIIKELATDIGCGILAVTGIMFLIFILPL